MWSRDWTEKEETQWKVGDLVEGFERGGSGVRESKMPALLYANIQGSQG